MSVSALVKTHWLRQLMLQSPKHLRILDASLQLSKENRDARQEFLAHRIPGAKFFDVNECADKSSPYAHRLPNAEEFADCKRNLGIRNDSYVVIYDNNDKVGLYSAPRAWWMFRALIWSSSGVSFGRWVSSLVRGRFSNRIGPRKKHSSGPRYLVNLSLTLRSSLACSQTLYIIFKVRRARVIKYKPQRIY